MSNNVTKTSIMIDTREATLNAIKDATSDATWNITYDITRFDTYISLKDVCYE